MELDVIFSRELHKKLKERVKGKVFCKVFDDELIWMICISRRHMTTLRLGFATVLVPIIFFMKLFKNTRSS